MPSTQAITTLNLPLVGPKLSSLGDELARAALFTQRKQEKGYLKSDLAWRSSAIDWAC